jgi:hypothetical protein
LFQLVKEAYYSQYQSVGRTNRTPNDKSIYDYEVICDKKDLQKKKMV